MIPCFNEEENIVEIGNAVAKEISENNLTLEEYVLENKKNYNR